MISALITFALTIASVTEAASVSRGLRARDDLCANKSTKLLDATKTIVCYTYCEKSNKQITGAPQKVGTDANCDLDKCTGQHSDTLTVSQTFTISIGATGDSHDGEESIMKAGASVGASWSWSKSTASTNSWSFDLANGDSGHVVFRPYYQQSCGVLSYYGQPCVDDQGMDCTCDDKPYAEDQNSCGLTPIYTSDGFADGEFTFCFTGGPHKGTGC